MNLEEIQTLVKAGYTKEEIKALEAGNSVDNAGAAGNESGAEVGADSESAGKEQSKSNPENASAINNGVDISVAIEALTNTVAGLKETVKAMQDANAAGAKTETAKKDVIKETMDSFLKGL